MESQKRMDPQKDREQRKISSTRDRDWETEMQIRTVSKKEHREIDNKEYLPFEYWSV